MSDEKPELLINFFGHTDLPDNSHERAMSQLASHIFLLTNVLVNVAYLIFVAGFGTGSLKKNFLQQLALLGALMQIGSCANSIHRYNIGDEYNFAIGNAGAAFGFASGVFQNIAISTIWFHGSTNRKMKWIIFSICWALVSCLAMYLELKNFEKSNFFWFRVINEQNGPYTMLCCYFTYRGLKNKKISIDPNIISHSAVTNLFMVLALFQLAWFLANATGQLIYIYIGGGMTFMTVTVATHFMGNFNDYYDSPVGGEGQPLLG